MAQIKIILVYNEKGNPELIMFSCSYSDAKVLATQEVSCKTIRGTTWQSYNDSYL
jgi:hypothetical protein